MVRIAISQAAFDAIAKSLRFGDVGYENAVNEKGLRGPGESYREAILRLAAEA